MLYIAHKKNNTEDSMTWLQNGNIDRKRYMCETMLLKAPLSEVKVIMVKRVFQGSSYMGLERSHIDLNVMDLPFQTTNDLETEDFQGQKKWLQCIVLIKAYLHVKCERVINSIPNGHKLICIWSSNQKCWRSRSTPKVSMNNAHQDLPTCEVWKRCHQ